MKDKPLMITSYYSYSADYSEDDREVWNEEDLESAGIEAAAHMYDDGCLEIMQPPKEPLSTKIQYAGLSWKVDFDIIGEFKMSRIE